MSPATFSLSLALGAALLVPQEAHATFIDLRTGGMTGFALDNPPSPGLPLTVAVAEIPGLNLTVASVGPAGSIVNGTASSFGLNSPGSGDEAALFDVDAAESLTFTFDQDVLIQNIALNSFTGDEGFSAGGVSFVNGDAPGNVFTFADGGLSLAAGSGFTLAAAGPAGTIVGVNGIDVVVVPEPSSLALLGLGGLMAGRRRRA